MNSHEVGQFCILPLKNKITLQVQDLRYQSQKA